MASFRATAAGESYRFPDLRTLLANVQRLARTGAPRQKAAANALLPALEELIQARMSVRAGSRVAAHRILH